jgi:hypothetical protein
VTKARTAGQKRRDKRQAQPVTSSPASVTPEPLDKAAIGPTPETMQHGDYVRGGGARAIYTNTHASVLAKLRGYSTITARQHAAGLAFERTWVAVWGTPSPGRDSTIPPVGGQVHETEGRAERHAKHRARLNTIVNRVGPHAYSILVSVAVFGESLGRERGNEGAYHVLRRCLDACAIAYGITDEVAA